MIFSVLRTEWEGKEPAFLPLNYAIAAHSAGQPVVYMKIKNEKILFTREARAKYVKNKAQLAFFT